MRAEEKVNFRLLFATQFPKCFKKNPPRQPSQEIHFCVINNSYKPIQKEGAGMWWERGDKYLRCI